MIQGPLQCQKVNLKVKESKYVFHQIQLRNCVIPHLHGILTGKTFYDIMFVIQGDLYGQKVNLWVKFLKIIFWTNTNII